MADYNSSYSGAQIDAAVAAVRGATSTPTEGSAALITSGGVAAGLALKADLNSPNLTGTPTTTHPDASSNSARIPTTKFVKDRLDEERTYVNARLDTKQGTLTWDDVPTKNSTHPVRSGGIYNAIQAVKSSYVIGGIRFHFVKQGALVCVRATGTNHEAIAAGTLMGSATVGEDFRPVNVGVALTMFITDTVDRNYAVKLVILATGMLRVRTIDEIIAETPWLGCATYTTEVGV